MSGARGKLCAPFPFEEHMTIAVMQGSRRRVVVWARQEAERRVEETPPPVSVSSVAPPVKNKGGRPKGSKNKPKEAISGRS
jgi:hypothetical protein